MKWEGDFVPSCFLLAGCSSSVTVAVTVIKAECKGLSFFHTFHLPGLRRSRLSVYDSKCLVIFLLNYSALCVSLIPLHIN